MTPFAAFSFSVRKYGLQSSPLLLAVSGGLDSVVLCELSRRAELSFAIAHGNFGLRGEESDGDEDFVRGLAANYRVPFYSTRFNTKTYAEEKGLSIQEAARNLRYEWFDQLRKEHGFAATLLAHHANDNVETTLMHLFRGTGLHGLTGMPERREVGRCVRPMLSVTRKEIEDFAKEAGLKWREDSSNSDSKYTRNLFRAEILPLLKKAYPQAEQNVLDTVRRLEQSAIIYNNAVAALKKKIYEPKGEEIHIPVLKLLRYQNTSLLYEVLKDFGFGESAVDELIKLAGAPSGKFIAAESHRIIRHGRWFIVAPLAIKTSIVVVQKGDEVIPFGDRRLIVKPVPADKVAVSPSETVAQLDVSQIDFPLVLRPWKAGDYFYPLGMKKKKKLARFFIDQKLSKTEKEKAYVLESHKRIVWVVGYRMDDRFKITDSTRQVLQLTASTL